MTIPIHKHIQQFQPKLHGLAVGITIAIGGTFLSQGCPLVGQCPACAACLPRLPLLAAPFAVDAVVMLATRIMEHKAEKSGD